MKKMHLLLVVMTCTLLASCATYKSSHGDKKEGVGYFLPKSLLKIETKVEGDPGQVVSVSISASDLMPDSAKFFLLQPGRSEARKTESTISVNSKGLLTTANVTATSSISEILTAVSDLGGQLSDPLGDGRTDQCKEGSYVALYEFNAEPDDNPEAGVLPCALKLNLDDGFFDTMEGADEPESNKSKPGIFYRQNIPYLVKVKEANEREWSAVTYSPSYAPVRYISAPRTFFADGTFNLTLDDGILLQVQQTNNSEILSAVTLPAAVLDAYMSAVGSIFTGTKSQADNQVAAQEALLSARLASIKYETCVAALSQEYESGEARTEALLNLGCIESE